MNIYAQKGDKVICNTLSAGYNYHREIANRYLKIGEEYTVEATQVYSSNTEVWLQDFPGIIFNSVFFKDSK